MKKKKPRQRMRSTVAPPEVKAGSIARSEEEDTPAPYTGQSPNPWAYGQGGTSADSYAPTGTSGETYSETPAALIDKILSRKNLGPVLFVGSIILSGFIFYQDNAAGLLKDIADIKFTLTKCGIVVFIGSVLWFGFTIFNRFSDDE